MNTKLEYAYNRYLAGWEYACMVQRENSSIEDYNAYLDDIKILDISEFEYRVTHHQEFADVFGKDCTIPLSLEARVDLWFHNDKPNRDVVDYFDDLPTEDLKLEFLKYHEVPIRKIID